VNYKKDGTKFYNHFYLAPLYNAEGICVYFIGIQTSIRVSSMREEEEVQEVTQSEADSTTAANWLAQIISRYCISSAFNREQHTIRMEAVKTAHEEALRRASAGGVLTEFEAVQ
jgi:hypothetical protein